MAGFSFSSSIPLGVFWWLVFLEVLAATVDNSNFMLPRAEAKPLVAEQPFEEEMCTATLEIETHQLVGKRVGLAEFGKSLNDNDFNEETLSFLTVLPDNYTSLCDDEDGDSAFAFFESVRNGISDIHPKGRPKAKIALLVDLASGDCDLLTRATNALKLQTDFASFKPRLKLKLKYVLFYVNRYSIDGNWGSTIPKLSLDETWPSTVAGPTCFLTHSNDPSSFPTSSPKPSASPSEEPSGSFLPSSAPSVSLEPSLSPSFGPSSTPSASMGPSSAPSVSSEPSLSPSFTPTSAPTVSWLPTSSRAPTLTSLPTTSLSTTLPIPDSNNVFPMGTNNIFDKTIPQKREVNSKNREGGWELQDLKLQRENQKKIIEENNSMVFLSISTSNAEEILHPFCENNLMHMRFLLTDDSMKASACHRGHVDPNDHDFNLPISMPVPQSQTTEPPTKQPQQSTRKPRRWPSQAPTPSSNWNSDSYSDNAPGSFTIFKFVLFGLLIASPCLRVAHQWWAAGGRIRLRRSNDEDSTRVVGLQYIPPMDYWFGGSVPESSEVPRIHDRLTHQDIMNLPEIIYTKPVHSDGVSFVETEEGITKQPIIEEEDHGGSSHLYNEDDDHSDNGIGIGIGIGIGTASTTETTETVDTPSETTSSSETTTIDGQPIEREVMDSDESIASEESFDNEPSTTILQLPSSPERVNSSTTTKTNTRGDEPLSPRAIVPTEELYADEERPEEQHQLQQPQPTTNTTTPQQESAAPHQQQEQQQPQHLSFRTQRRLRHFTTTTCTTCSICIDEFEEGEKVRLLPLCGHAFHTECIMPWLKDRHGCCPLCKTGVLDENNSSNNSNQG